MVLTEAAKVMLKNDLNPALYVLIAEIENRLIVKQRFTGEIRVLEK